MWIDKSDIPPGAEAAVRRFQNSLADLETQRNRLQRLAEEDMEPFAGITETQLNSMAREPGASPQLAACEAAIARGEYTWREVVEGGRPRPPEVARLIEQGIPFSFATAGSPSSGAVIQDDRTGYDDPYDDEEELGPPKSWLV
ncbi:hypothetical protein F3087_02640 [Nocardia colli]|uniref:Uncharacterized protein n=1 Tax=Nocardia colli TaxID=2545717 RepID=A0A5N0EQ67_9NOCA|nr:hypothetical protein [Nocardia colli]KAA8890225.1 hypothetical protein F3087_02640 [Nocardia colli]